MSVDYFDIKIDDTISTFGADNTLNACYFKDDAGVLRAHQPRPSNGNAVARRRLRAGPQHEHRLARDHGLRHEPRTTAASRWARSASLNFNLTGTYLDELITHGPGDRPGQCDDLRLRRLLLERRAARRTRSGGTMPRLGWQTPWYGRPVAHLALLRRRRRSSRGEPRAASTTSCDATNYFDLAANWAVTEKASILVGINNVLDDGSADHLGSRHDGQRQHVPADLRRARSLDLHPRAGRVLIPS